MRPDSRDMARLWDMLDAARTVVEFVGTQRYEDFLDDRKTRNAVERNLEIMGEAAKCVSQEMRANHPDMPWRAIIGLRNVLAHEYGDLRYEVLWAVIEEKLPLLIQKMEEMGLDSPPSLGEP